MSLPHQRIFCKRRVFARTKVKARPRYYWLCATVIDFDGNWIETCTGSHRKPKPTKSSWPLRLVFRSLNTGYAGWDIDRHRFFVSANKTVYSFNPFKSRGRFLTEIWERNHGYGSRKLQRRHI